jgi:hypothetical protein
MNCYNAARQGILARMASQIPSGKNRADELEQVELESWVMLYKNSKSTTYEAEVLIPARKNRTYVSNIIWDVYAE